MKDYVEQLRHVDLFSKLNDGQLELISRIRHVRTVNKGQIVFQEGETGDSLYIILDGKVKVSLYDESGKEYVLDVIEKGGFFGELSLIDEKPRSANVTAIDNSEFLVINRHEFVRVLTENPSITLGILKTLSTRLRAADERIRGLAFVSVEGRILKHLTDLAKHSGVKIKDFLIIKDGPTQSEIASSCGCSRETVSRMVKSLIAKGALSVRKKQYTINPGKVTY